MLRSITAGGAGSGGGPGATCHWVVVLQLKSFIPLKKIFLSHASHSIKLTLLKCTVIIIFALLCHHHQNLIPEHSISPRKALAVTPPPPPPQPLTTTHPLCVCGSACSGRFPSVVSHPVCPSVSASLTERRVLRVRPCGSKCQGFSPWLSDLSCGYL